MVCSADIVSSATAQNLSVYLQNQIIADGKPSDCTLEAHKL